MIVKTLMPDVYKPGESDPAFIKVLKELRVLVIKLSTCGLAMALVDDDEKVAIQLKEIRQELSQLPFIEPLTAAQIVRVDMAAERRDAETIETIKMRMSKIH
ncbi:hypothetical protein BGW41_006778, partial [Actinomortierella wolfii]